MRGWHESGNASNGSRTSSELLTDDFQLARLGGRVSPTVHRGACVRPRVFPHHLAYDQGSISENRVPPLHGERASFYRKRKKYANSNALLHADIHQLPPLRGKPLFFP